MSTSCGISDVGTVFEVLNTQCSGLSMQLTWKMYVREECKKLWEMLNGLVINDLLFVTGSPGIGKSTLVYSYCSYKATLPEEKMNIFWIHKDITQVFAIHFHSGNYYTFREKDIEMQLSNLIENMNVDLVVLDGFTTSFKEAFGGIITKKNTIIVCCTSFASDSSFSTSETESLKEMHGRNRVKRFTMDSWRFEEYVAAEEVGIFPEGFDLRAHFAVGGTSIRLLKKDIDEVIITLDKSIEKLNNVELVFEGLSGYAGTDSVNTLMQCRKIDGKAAAAAPLSRYVVERLAEKCGNKFFEMAKKVMVDNGSFQGWVFEYEVIYLIVHGQIKFDCDLQNEWCIGNDANYLYYDTMNDIAFSNVQDNTWLLSNRYIGGCIDMCYYKNSNCVYLVQVTVAKQHQYDMTLVLPLLKGLMGSESAEASGSKNVHFVVVIPDGNTENFKIECNHFLGKNHVGKQYDARWNNDDVFTFCKLICLEGITLKNVSTGSELPTLSTLLQNVTVADNTRSNTKKRKILLENNE